MILKSLTLKNFKSIGNEPQTINFSPITLLFGPNSAGKSTILKSLFYLHEMITTGNANPSKLSRLPGRDIGGFQSLIHAHDLDREMKIKVEFDIKNSNYSSYSQHYYEDSDYSGNSRVDEFIPALWLVNNIGITVAIKWSYIQNAPQVVRYAVEFDDRLVASIDSSLDGANNIFNFHVRNMFIDWYKYDKTKANIIDQVIETVDYNVDAFKDMAEFFIEDGSLSFSDDGVLSLGEGRKKSIPKPGKILDFGSSVYDMDVKKYTKFNAIVSDYLVAPLDNLNTLLEDILYVGPLRDIPPRNFKPEAIQTPDRWLSGLAAWDVLALAEESFVNKVSQWFGDAEYLDSGYEVRVKRYRELSSASPLMLALSQNRQDLLDADWIEKQLKAMPELSRITLWDKRAGIELHPQDLGVGISQVLPVVVLALLGRSGKISCIEQPELHIHPAFQVVLGDLFAAALQGEKPARFIIETHSEHLMLRLLKRIRQTTDNELEPDAPRLSPQDVTVVYVEPGDLGVQIRNIRIDDDGEFMDAWPKGFFAERRQELM